MFQSDYTRKYSELLVYEYVIHLHIHIKTHLYDNKLGRDLKPINLVTYERQLSNT
jgi:hypothetical protein